MKCGAGGIGFGPRQAEYQCTVGYRYAMESNYQDQPARDAIGCIPWLDTFFLGFKVECVRTNILFMRPHHCPMKRPGSLEIIFVLQLSEYSKVKQMRAIICSTLTICKNKFQLIIICGSHRILYVVRDDSCYITAIVHGSRDLPSAVNPEDWDLD